MDEARSPEELRERSDAFSSRLESLNRRLAALEASRPPEGSDRNARRVHERWMKKMLALTNQGDTWGREYLEFLREGEPLLAAKAKQDPRLQQELEEWRRNLQQMENSLSE